MSLNSKLRTALSVVFILTTAAAFSVTAQTPTENSSTSAVASTSSTITPKAVDNEKPSTPPVENLPADKNAEVGPSEDTATTNAATRSATTANAPTTPAPQTVDPDKWQFQFSPYFWLAGLHGTGGIGNRTTRVDESFSDVFDSLNFAFMGMFEARKGKFISLTDLEYVSVSDEKATPGPLFSTVDAGFKTFIFDQEVGYRLLENAEKGDTACRVGWRSSLACEDGLRVWCWNPSGSPDRGQSKLG
jgi:hypothetical protein